MLCNHLRQEIRVEFWLGLLVEFREEFREEFWVKFRVEL